MEGRPSDYSADSHQITRANRDDTHSSFAVARTVAHTRVALSGMLSSLAPQGAVGQPACLSRAGTGKHATTARSASETVHAAARGAQTPRALAMHRGTLAFSFSSLSKRNAIIKRGTKTRRVRNEKKRGETCPKALVDRIYNMPPSQRGATVQAPSVPTWPRHCKQPKDFGRTIALGTAST